MSRTFVALAVAAALLSPSAALAVRAKKKVHFLRAPRMDLPAYTTIGVVGVDGWAGPELESALVTAFLDKTRGLRFGEGLGPEDPVVAWPDHFPVVERSRLDLIVGERTLGAGPLDDAELRDSLADVLGAGVLITGTSKRPIWGDEWGTTEETQEVEVTREKTTTSVEVETEEDWWGDEETTVTIKETTTSTTSVEEQEVVTEWCLTRNVLLSFDLRAIDARTGRILAADTVQASNSDYKCSDTRKKTLDSVASVESLAVGAIDSLAYRAANRVAPYWGTMKLVFERNKKTKDGVLLLTKGDDLAGAAAWFVDEAGIDPYDEWIQYGAGLCLASMYRFEEARERLRAARAINDRKVFRRLDRLIHDLERDYERLQRMGVPMRPLDLPGVGAGDVGGTEEVVVRGGRKRMSDILSGQGVGSVVARVPGGMALTLLDHKGDWVRVRTFDNKEGWIHIDDLR